VDIKLALLICREGQNRERVALAARRCGLNPICCSNLDEASGLLVQVDFNVVLCEDILPDGDFYMALRMVREAGAAAPLIVLSQTAEWEAYLKALGAGAFDYILCPASLVESERILRCALENTTHRPKAARMAV
jgi:DNA-binding NtrC family response regulator